MLDADSGLFVVKVLRIVPTAVPLPQAAGVPILRSTLATTERSAVVVDAVSNETIPVTDLVVVLGEIFGTELLFSAAVSQ